MATPKVDEIITQKIKERIEALYDICITASTESQKLRSEIKKLAEFIDRYEAVDERVYQFHQEIFLELERISNSLERDIMTSHDNSSLLHTIHKIERIFLKSL